MNVLEMRGPDFLAFYAMALGSLTLLAIVARWLLRGPGGEAPKFVASLEPYEVAYLSGGPRMAVDAALAGLIHMQAVSIDATGGRLRAKEALPEAEQGFQRQVYEQVAGRTRTVSDVHYLARGLTASMADRLRELDLALTSGSAILARLVPAALLVPVLMLGIAKVRIGLSRYRPVEFLIILCIATGILMLIFAFKPCYRTRTADRVLRLLRRNSAALRTSVAAAPDRLANTDIAMAMALFGPAVLSSGALLTLRRVLTPQGGGGGDSGGGCGGGGCGGGGCGGCGGG